MISKLVVVFILSACVCSPLVSAAQLIELTDANQAILKLELSKNVKWVQEAYNNGFEFKSIPEASRFLLHCHDLKDKMSTAKDSDYEGMAAKIKVLLAEHPLVDACNVDYENFEAQYGAIDELSAAALDYLSESKINRLVEIKRDIESNVGLEVLLGYLVDEKIGELSKGLLANGVTDINYLFDEQYPQNGFFSFDHVHKSGCTISHLRPICKFVRRSHFDDVSAIGEDFVDFVKIFVANDQEKINYHQEKSEVDFETVKEECHHVIGKDLLRPIKQIKKFETTGFLSDATIRGRFYLDKDLHLYYEIYNMCLEVSK